MKEYRILIREGLSYKEVEETGIAYDYYIHRMAGKRFRICDRIKCEFFYCSINNGMTIPKYFIDDRLEKLERILGK